MDERPDEELVVDIKGGSILAYEQLVKRYQQRLFVFAYRILHDERAAQEVVQDALFAVYTSIDRIDPKRKFSSYVFEITKNTAISYLRRRKQELSLDSVELAKDDEAIYENLINKERSSFVQNALGKLNEKYRTIIRLYYFDDLSYEEIGRKLHLPLNTVRTHLRRAKATIEKLLAHETY